MKSGLVVILSPSLEKETRQLIALARNGEVSWAPAIIAAVRMFEAFLDELRDALGRQAEENKRFADAYVLSNEVERERGSLPLKVQVLAIALQSSALPRGDVLFQDFKAALVTRNRIVHMETTVLTAERHPGSFNFISHLVNRKIISPPLEGTEANWTQHILVEPVASWVLDTMLTLMRTFFEMLPDSQLRRLVANWHPALLACD